MKKTLYTPRCLGYIGDYTTQLRGDYFKTITKIPMKQPEFQWKVGFFRGSC